MSKTPNNNNSPVKNSSTKTSPTKTSHTHTEHYHSNSGDRYEEPGIRHEEARHVGGNVYSNTVDKDHYEHH